MVTSLSEDKRTALKKIGFGSFLSLSTTKLPKNLPSISYNTSMYRNQCIQLEHATVNIDEEDVNLVLGILHGTKIIDEFNKDTPIKQKNTRL